MGGTCLATCIPLVCNVRQLCLGSNCVLFRTEVLEDTLPTGVRATLRDGGGGGEGIPLRAGVGATLRDGIGGGGGGGGGGGEGIPLRAGVGATLRDGGGGGEGIPLRP